MKLFLSILFGFLFFNCPGQQTPEKVSADKISALDYVNNQVGWTKTYVDAEIRSVRDAVEKVERTNTAKFESVNEFRSQLKDQAGTFVTRKELSALISSLWTAVIALGTLIVAAAGVILKYKKPALSDKQNDKLTELSK